MSSHELKIQKIREGTVIDHIPAGNALNVLKILNITGKEGNIVSVAMNVPSKKYGKKDIIKIEGKELNPKEVNTIALIARRATINIIRDYQVHKKYRVKIPETIENIVKCSNPQCITNGNEPIAPIFKVISTNPIELRCRYCQRITTYEDILKQFT